MGWLFAACASNRLVAVFDRLKEFSAEGNRSASLMLELQACARPQPADALADGSGGAAAASLLHQWMRAPDSFVEAIRQELDCNNDHMVSKMEFRRWAKGGVLVAVLNSMAHAAAITPMEPLQATSVPSSHSTELASATTSADSASASASATAAPCGDSGAHVHHQPPPNCPFSQWTAYKPCKSNPDVAAANKADGSDRIIVLKGPAFSDQCEEHYNRWKLDARACKLRRIAGCEDASAELNFLTMEIQGQIIGISKKLANFLYCHTFP